MDQPMEENIFVEGASVDLSEPLPESGSLTAEQQQRHLALTVALPMLTGQRIGGTTPPNLSDLIALATWIINGEAEPLYPYADADSQVWMGPNVVMRPDGYVDINGTLYLPSDEPEPEEMPSA